MLLIYSLAAEPKFQLILILGCSKHVVLIKDNTITISLYRGRGLSERLMARKLTGSYPRVYDTRKRPIHLQF